MAKKRSSKRTARRSSKRSSKRSGSTTAILNEHETFEEDEETTSEGKNEALAELLHGPWLDLAIVRIDRIEIGSRQGWRALHRK
jgi:hypothetical protein